MNDVRLIAESTFRAESGRILATLIRLSGSFHLAEEALQDAFASALAHWPAAGIPHNPGAWITTAARRKLADAFRRKATRSENEPAVRSAWYGSTEHQTALQALEDDSMHFPDDRLRLIFTCCHPALNRPSQVALTLRTLCGLTTAEIARAFLLPEPTLSQRLVRAKDKIQSARIPYVVPPTDSLPGRLASVQSVIYLVFNEGYSASTGAELTRLMLCDEAIRLARLLNQLLPSFPETTGLLALMLLQDSRRAARVAHLNDFVPLDEQDRSLWDRQKIAEGLALLETALRQHAIGPYQLQAAIAALYAELLKFTPNPVVSLNRAVAIAMAGDLAAGLSLIEQIGAAGHLASYHLFHAARAELLRRMNRPSDAHHAYTQALHLTQNDVERRYLLKRIHETSGPVTELQ